MTSTSVDSDSPPGQDAPDVIQSWTTEGYCIQLKDAGANGATIVCTQKGGGPAAFGRIRFDPAQNRHIIEWNRSGRLALEEYKRDHWDSKFYYAMAARRRA
jgi:hypothetical protein